MKGKIVFEEHMSLPETLEDSRTFVGGSAKWDDFERQILDVGDERLEGMERNGIGFAILSLNAPAIQSILNTNTAIETAKRANEHLANAIARHPDRFAPPTGGAWTRTPPAAGSNSSRRGRTAGSCADPGWRR